MATSKLYVFGPQALSFDADIFLKLRTKILSDPLHRWALDVLSSLETTLLSASRKIPLLRKYNQATSLQNLTRALRTGQISTNFFPIPNTLLSPLVVVSQLIDYLEYIQAVVKDLEEHTTIPQSVLSNAETLGICTGILSAFAVGSSKNIIELKKYGTVAAKLALLSGALVDTEDASRESSHKSISFSISWAAADFSDVEAILQNFTEAYISIHVDEKRATVTCARSVVDRLQQALKAKSISISPIALNGRFHWPAHQKSAAELIQYVNDEPTLQYNDASRTVLPAWGNDGLGVLQSGQLHEIALKAILIDCSKWFDTVTAASSFTQSSESRVFVFGPEPCLPPTIARKLESRLIHVSDLTSATMFLGSLDGPDERVAVIGMSCNMPNAEDLDEYWQVLLSGESQHREIPIERFTMNTYWRDADPKRKWYGNFIRDPDAFDHKFFKKSPREMGSTDPQHRIILQLAYQAVQQAGYFAHPNPDKKIGVYIGQVNSDYEHNIHCHPANAYSATGNLRSLAAGRISHYFGWLGPSMSLDTACSSSSVAIHLACRAILSGEITGALAGGVTVFTSPEWFYDLAGASFLSPTGQCKPFDIKGDGYCRGEGCGLVFLKKYSTAVADGDQILGVIAGTSVLQNQNCTPIVVPNSLSLSDLFRGVIKRARVTPHDITVVEAHGTGTAVGDPAEYGSIREVLGGSTRPDILTLTAVKGTIGHLEGSSGVASVIKILLMMYEGIIPPQASFQTINPAFKMMPDDNIEITAKIKPWTSSYRVALINNYGASGSNASMIVTEAARLVEQRERLREAQLIRKIFPFWFSGFDESSLKNYCQKFRQYLKDCSAAGKKIALSNLSFQLSRQSNRTLGQSLILHANSVEDLDQKLEAFGKDTESQSLKKGDTRPVILCFGGQISTFVGLDKEIYDNVNVLKNRLDQCDKICTSLGLDSIYPDIFQQSPLSDTVQLQIALFALQWSCAMAWIDCGVKITAIIGHSFGELTGLCVSGILPLADAVQLISKRASILQKSWTGDKGSMMAVEGDLVTVERLVTVTHGQGKADISIACYNGPRSYTLGGSAASIKLAETITKDDETFAGMKVKVLDVTNAFHSSLVDPIVPELVLLGRELTFHKPVIRLEHATKQAGLVQYNENFVSTHLRSPVYFHHAVERLSNEYRDALWLEAGSNSTITNMVSKTLANSGGASFCQPINITSVGSWSHLVGATTKLWLQGLEFAFWLHHKSQITDYVPLLLPPYQFEKSRHWLAIKEIPISVEQSTQNPAPVLEPEPKLFTLHSFLDDQKHSMRFRINNTLPEFKEKLEGHIMANTIAVMPGMYPVEIAIDVISSLRPEFQSLTYQPELQNMVYYSSCVPTHSSAIWMDVKASNPEALIWDWALLSQDAKGSISKHNDFARLGRLGSYKRCKRLLTDLETNDVIAGRNIYRAFEAVIDYRDPYRIVTKLVGKDGEFAGRVIRTHDKQGWLDSVLTDGFCQIGGVAVNLFSDPTDFTERGIYIGDRVDRWVRSPGLAHDPTKPQDWEVFAMSHAESDTAFVTDIFAFDARNGALYEAVLGVRFSRAMIPAIRRVLGRIISENPLQVATTTVPPSTIQAPTFNGLSIAAVQQPQISSTAPSLISNRLGEVNGFRSTVAPNSTTQINSTNISPKATASTKLNSNLVPKLKEILCNLSGVEVEDIHQDSDLIEMGIDSLMAMELTREIDAAFQITLEIDRLMDLTDVRSLINCITSILGIDVAGKMDNAVNKAATTMYTNHTTSNSNEKNSTHTNGIDNHSSDETRGDNHGNNGFPASLLLDVTRQTKAVTDEFIVNNKMSSYYSTVRPLTTMLCASYIVEAFEKLGCSLKNALPGEILASIFYSSKHERYMKELCKIIGPDEVNLVEIHGSHLIRTTTACPEKPAAMLFQEALKKEPDHAPEFRLLALIGTNLVECLAGKEDGVQIIFGSAEGRQIVSDVYAVAPINYNCILQAAFYLEQLLRRLPHREKINILEMGAGTGGTTLTLVPLLAKLGVPITYTFTDLSSSLVAAARKRFKQYPFMEFKVVNIESAPAKEFLHTQHIVLANACVHATRSLPISLRNIHDTLRSDGVLMLLEETEQLPWVDFVFGLFEGWWSAVDGRTNPQVSADHWERVLRGAGFGHVDYTDGKAPEVQAKRIIFGFASDIRYVDSSAMPTYLPTLSLAELTTSLDRQEVIESYVAKYVADFCPPTSSVVPLDHMFGDCVLITGATGSLGSHLVWSAVQMPNIRKVFCINRIATKDAGIRQEEAFSMRGINIPASSKSKLQILETDLSKSKLGLPSQIYCELLDSVTYLVHSAWPMSLTRTTKAYKLQFQIMRNLINFARECIGRRPEAYKFSFQFISSIGAMGYYPLWTGCLVAPEVPTTATTALPIGYADAKIVCENMLNATLRRYPQQFRAMSVRIAQITGSRTNGYWNPIEHFSFFVKSAQHLETLPDLRGTLSWSPVNEVADSLLDILISDTVPYPIYHIENPKRQSWSNMIQLLAKELKIPPQNIVSYKEWMNRVRSDNSSMADNPAKQLMSFWEKHFLRMSTGPLVLSTEHSREHSKTMRESGPVEDELVRRYINGWKQCGFLASG